MTDTILNIMTTLGYPGIVLLMVLENVFPPLPSELILPAAGFAAAQGELTLWGVYLAAGLGSVIGTLPLYYLGRLVGEERLIAWADRHGRWLALRGQDIRQADAWFDRHGTRAVLFGRMVPGVRSLLSIPAGISGMPLPTFLLYSAIGSTAWAALLATAGYLLGERWEEVGGVVGPAGTALIAALLVGVVLVLRRRRQGAQGS